jgi:hypothetical protein
MANSAPYKHGEFCWFEVNTPDAEAAKKFYGALFGWKTQQMDMGGSRIIRCMSVTSP